MRPEIRNDGSAITLREFEMIGEFEQGFAHLSSRVSSAYHRWNDAAHGEEREPTLRWVDPGRQRSDYHCDFVFLSEDLSQRLEGVTVGTAMNWIESGLSDHCPVTVEISDHG